MDSSILIYCLCAVIFVIAIVAGYRFIRRHMLGTFKYDNSGETYRCRLEFESIDEVEKLRFAIVKVKEENLGLPGESKSQFRQPL